MHLCSEWALKESGPLNERWRFNKYRIGQRFGPHFDAGFQKHKNEKTLMTFIVYLNEGFDGKERSALFLFSSILLLSQVDIRLSSLMASELLGNQQIQSKRFESLLALALLFCSCKLGRTTFDTKAQRITRLISLSTSSGLILYSPV